MGKIETETKILKVATTPQCAQVEFDSGEFNQEQNRLIARWVQDKEVLLITIDGIASKAIIKKATVEADGEGLAFKGFDFTPTQYGKLAAIVKKGEPVKVVYEPVQQELPGLDGTAPGQEDLDFEKAEPKKMQSPDNPNQRRTPAQMQTEDLKRMKKELLAKKTAKKRGKH